MKNERGVTLLVLSITIIVMFILAGVSMYMAIGNDGGVINEVKTETKKQQDMVKNEKDKMNDVLDELEKDWGLS